MSFGRIFGTSAAVVAVGVAAVSVVGLASAQPKHRPMPNHRSSVAALARPIPAQLPAARPSSSATHTDHAVKVRTRSASAEALPSTSALVTSLAPAPTTTSPVVTRETTTRATPTRTVTTHATPKPTPRPTPTQTHQVAHTAQPHSAALRRGVRLPVSGRTGSATRVITVKARATWKTVATLQAWRKAPGGGWLRVGKPAAAHIGSQGMTRSPSESKSATPIGSFTLTQAFGYAGNPGTRLHFFRTNGEDWWISQRGSLYNTHRHCWSGCGFRQGSPNEHLYYERPFYKYAVVIDYNTRNSPGGVRQGAGSAFFLHVTDGNPTAGCVAIREARLKPIMRWLLPSRHPRILIGTS
ncbi:MAG TPA: hypothetical protein VGH43_12460 [Jatrophihabitans sp.]